MKRLLLLVAVAVAASASLAQATNHKMGGCGLGSLIFRENEKPHQILAATTNGIFGNQTFGISSETLGCTKDGMVKADKRAEVYAEVNFRNLNKEMAAGSGEYLDAFASVMGCRDTKAFAEFAQKNFTTLIPSETTGSDEMLTNLRAAMSKDSTLSKSCAL